MEKINNLVSVIIPAYNCECTIENAIHAILNQTYQNLELIIVNDGSSDNTSKKIKSIHDNRIKYIDLEKNTKKIGAVNHAFELAIGDFICFLDADDTCSIEKIQLQLDCFINNPELGVCFTGYSINGNKEPKKKWREKDEDLQSEFNFSHQEVHLMNTVCATIMFKKEILRIVGGYNEYFAGKLGEDFEWCFRLLKNTKAATLPKELYSYNLTNLNSITNQANKNGIKHYDFVFLKELISFRNTYNIDPLSFDLIKLRDFELTVAFKTIHQLSDEIEKTKKNFLTSNKYRIGGFIVDFLNFFKLVK